MFTNNEEWLRIECGHCKYFNVNVDMEGIESTCKRLDHKHLRFAKKIFKCYDCGQTQTTTCADFEPGDIAVWLKDHWGEIDIIPYKDTDVILLNVDGNTDVRYAVKAIDFYNNTFRNADGSLKWVYKKYSVRTKNSCSGYKTVYEYSNE